MSTPLLKLKGDLAKPKVLYFGCNLKIMSCYITLFYMKDTIAEFVLLFLKSHALLVVLSQQRLAMCCWRLSFLRQCQEKSDKWSRKGNARWTEKRLSPQEGYSLYWWAASKQETISSPYPFHVFDVSVIVSPAKHSADTDTLLLSWCNDRMSL